MRLLIVTLLLAISYAQTEQTMLKQNQILKAENARLMNEIEKAVGAGADGVRESEVGFGGGSWTVESPGSFLQRIGEMFEPKEDNGGCHANLIPYDGYCYGTMDYLTESSSLATKGRDQSGRFMTVPSDCEVAPPDSAVVQNVVMMSPFGTTLVVFKDGSGFGTSMTVNPPLQNFGPGLKYEGSMLPSLISQKGDQWATAIGHAKVFLRCKSPEAVKDSLDIPHFPTREEERKPLMVYCGVNKCEEFNSCYTAIQNLEEDKDWNDLQNCPNGYSMMGSHNDQKSYCRDPGTVYLHDLTILPDWLVPDQWLRVCLYTGSEVALSQLASFNSQKTGNYGPEYVGCMSFTEAEERLTLRIGKDTPRNCMKKCLEMGSAYFGLVSNSCFCVKQNVNSGTESDGCQTSPDGLPIGGDNAISVYTTTQTYDSITCDELCASGEAGSLCTCDTQPPAKSATTGPQALSILEQNEAVVYIFALIGCISLVYYGLKYSCIKVKRSYKEVRVHEEI